MRTVRAYWASSKTLVLLTHCSAVSTFNLVYNRTIITYVHISIIKGHLYHNFLAQRQQNSVVHTVLYRSTCTDPTCYDSVCVCMQLPLSATNNHCVKLDQNFPAPNGREALS